MKTLKDFAVIMFCLFKLGCLMVEKLIVQN